METLAAQIANRLRERPLFFADLAREFEAVPWRDLLRAWGEVRQRFTLERDEEGHYRIPSAAKGRARSKSTPARAAARGRGARKA